MTQNIYDDEGFFREYSRLPRSVAGLDAAPEWSALRALLPDLDGLTVVDLGCGFGWFCRWVREQGAASVLGIRAPDLYRAFRTPMVDKFGWPQDLAGRQLSGGGPAEDGLAGQRGR